MLTDGSRLRPTSCAPLGVAARYGQPLAT
jgi:hypothetical protein